MAAELTGDEVTVVVAMPPASVTNLDSIAKRFDLSRSQVLRLVARTLEPEDVLRAFVSVRRESD